MIKCEPLCKDNDYVKCEPLCKDKEYVKTPLYGKCTIDCGCTIVLFDGKHFCSSFGTVEFKNEGDCDIEIFKNQLPCPVATIPPGACFSLASTPLEEIIVKCKRICKCTKCSDSCDCNKCSENYSCGTSKGWSKCNYNKCSCDKCILCYKGWVCSKIPNVDCPEMCC